MARRRDKWALNGARLQEHAPAGDELRPKQLVAMGLRTSSPWRCQTPCSWHTRTAPRTSRSPSETKGKGRSTGGDPAPRLPPWGWYESIALGPRFQVKRIVVNPGAALSLQSHNHRSEHWIVVEGTAQGHDRRRVKTVTENQSVYIPLGAVHRMENPGKLPLTLIEVQTGSYFGEDDIIRYEDVYSRGQGAKG